MIFVWIGSVAAESMRTESLESASSNHTSAAYQNIDGLSGICTPVIAEQDKVAGIFCDGTLRVELESHSIHLIDQLVTALSEMQHSHDDASSIHTILPPGNSIFATSWNLPMGFDDHAAGDSSASAGHVIHGGFFGAVDFTLIRQPATIFLFGVGLTVAASMRLRKTK